MKTPIGAIYNSDTKSCLFKVWSPNAKEVQLRLLSPEDSTHTMAKDAWGYWQIELTDISPGTTYQYQLDNSNLLPDPASRYQPKGPHGPSSVVDLSFNWTDKHWKGVKQEELIIYELHVGTFSEAGTFAGIEEKLDHLLELGVNAIEIMPVAQFPGERNWGYDGVSLFATQNSYGGPDAFRQLINRCHEKGIAVILDVVYNHLGPEGNYLSQFGPYFTDKYNTPWGQALNFDDAWCDPVRNFFLQNALMWLRDFHVDGLRLDAVHAIKDLSAKHFLSTLSEEVDTLRQETKRNHFLIAEVDLNDNKFISERERGGYGLHAQWIDEFHHAVHAWLTGEKIGYYADFGDFEHLEKAYRQTYVYNGNYSPHRKKFFGSSAEGNPYDQFVVFIQNHDHTGNRMLGERLTELISFDALKVGAASYLLSPYLPMLFMGEEWAEQAPFYYFVSHTDPKLVEAVRQGRKREFADFHSKGTPPDPQSEETFKASKLNWQFKEDKQQKAMWQFYKALIRIRKENDCYLNTNRDTFQLLSGYGNACLGLYKSGGNQNILSFLNLSNEPAQIPLQELPEGDFHLQLHSGQTEFGGTGQEGPEILSGQETLELAPNAVIVYQTKR